jgi:hypothetical protein
MRDVSIETVTNKSSVVWTGELRGEALRLVEDAEGTTVVERLTGHDALGNERWDPVMTKQALDDVRAILPAGLEIGERRAAQQKKLPYGLVVLPKGLTFRDLTRVNEAGERALLLMFPAGFSDEADNTDAVEHALCGQHVKLILEGNYERGSFYVRTASYYPAEAQPVVEERGCAMVTAALRNYLRRGDPEERFGLANAAHSVTATRLLELLENGDKRALSFVQDMHNAALRAIRQRTRKPPKSPRW